MRIRYRIIVNVVEGLSMFSENIVKMPKRLGENIDHLNEIETSIDMCIEKFYISEISLSREL